jgi:hypothetical protein
LELTTIDVLCNAPEKAAAAAVATVIATATAAQHSVQYMMGRRLVKGSVDSRHI